MRESNRGPEGDGDPLSGARNDAATAGAGLSPGQAPDPETELAAIAEAWESEGGAPAPAPDPIPAGPPILRGLVIWFVIIALLGGVGVVLGQAELALSVALAGAFVAAHAADRDPGFTPLHQLLSGLLVGSGALLLAGLAYWLTVPSEAPPAPRLALKVRDGCAASAA